MDFFLKEHVSAWRYRSRVLYTPRICWWKNPLPLEWPSWNHPCSDHLAWNRPILSHNLGILLQSHSCIILCVYYVQCFLPFTGVCSSCRAQVFFQMPAISKNDVKLFHFANKQALSKVCLFNPLFLWNQHKHGKCVEGLVVARENTSKGKQWRFWYCDFVGCPMWLVFKRWSGCIVIALFLTENMS